MGGGGGQQSSGSTTTVQKSDPWGGQQPFLRSQMGLAAGLAGAPVEDTSNVGYSGADAFRADPNRLEFYQGSTVAPFSNETETALQMQAARGFMGSPLEAAGKGELTNTLAGGYLGAGNPYFSNMMDSVAGDVRSRMDAQFGNSGRYGSGAHAHAMADALSDVAGKLGYANYENERENMQRAAFAAPGMAALDYQNIGMLADAGAQRENLAQAQINEDIERFNFNQMEPWTRLGLMQSLTEGNYGGTGTATSTGMIPRGSRFGGAMSGALGGAGIGASFGPWGAGIGAGLGLLGSLF